MTSSAERPAVRHRGVIVALAMGGMNLTLYVFTVVAARLLGPREYGAFASLMAVLIVVAVVQLRHPGHRGPADLGEPGACCSDRAGGAPPVSRHLSWWAA